MVLGYVLIVLSAISFSLIPAFALYAYDSGVTTTTLLFLRFAIAAVIFFSYLLIKGEKLTLTKKQFVSLLLLGGALYTLQSSLYFTSVKYIPTSLAALLLYLYPIFVAALSFFFNKEPLTKKVILSISLSLIGIIFVLGAPKGTISVFGILLASASAVVYSTYILIGDRVTKQLPPMITSAYIALFSSISFFFLGSFTDSLSFEFDRPGWVMIGGVAFFCSVVAMSTFFAGMNLIGPTKASILSMLEPVCTFALSTVLFQEEMSALQLLGGFLVLSGAIFVVLAREKTVEVSLEIKKKAQAG